MKFIKEFDGHNWKIEEYREGIIDICSKCEIVIIWLEWKGSSSVYAHELAATNGTKRCHHYHNLYCTDVKPSFLEYHDYKVYNLVDHIDNKINISVCNDCGLRGYGVNDKVYALISRESSDFELSCSDRVVKAIMV